MPRELFGRIVLLLALRRDVRMLPGLLRVLRRLLVEQQVRHQSIKKVVRELSVVRRHMGWHMDRHTHAQPSAHITDWHELSSITSYTTLFKSTH